ncbi:MAG: double zinc ribbon domain-containing protein, partial [Tateyamaria sp.]
MGLLQTALTAIYPPRCLGCGDMVDSDFGLCGACWGQTAFVGGTVCDTCSTPLPGAAADEPVQCDACLRTPKPW